MIRLAALALSLAGVVLFAIALASVFSSTACFPASDSGPGGGGSNAYSYTSCPNGSQSTPACLQCLAASCGSQIDGVNSACASYLECLCPPGANAQACATEEDDAGTALLTSACNDAQNAIYTCALTYCFDECQPDAG